MGSAVTGDAGSARAGAAPVGILVTNLGTPDAPTPKALRKYLKEFLWDPRVIEPPPARWKWWLILHAFVLTFRPAKSAALYRKIWWEEGSPLLRITERQAAGIERALRERVGSPVHVAVGMRYGNPSIASGLEALREKGCRRILVLPLYPQYSASTTGSTFDAVADALKAWRWVPELRFVQHYHDEPGYVRALAASIREQWAESGTPEKLVMSFHGVPERYVLNGDPYYAECMETGRLVAAELGLADAAWEVTFQSLFGKEEWLKPYTDRTLEAMAGSGIRHVDVACPGFSADCLETLEEIDQLNRENFTHAGGERYHYVPALNDRADHVAFLADLVERHVAGWVVPAGEWDAKAAEAAAVAARADAERVTPDWPVPADGGYGSRA